MQRSECAGTTKCIMWTFCSVDPAACNYQVWERSNLLSCLKYSTLLFHLNFWAADIATDYCRQVATQPRTFHLAPSASFILSRVKCKTRVHLPTINQISDENTETWL